MDLKLIRGDTYDIAFTIETEDNTNYVLADGDKIYFTVKKNFHNKNAILQRYNGNGIIYDREADEYIIELNQECTCNMECGSYVYDIKLVINSNNPRIVKTLIKGSLQLDTNATHKENER